MRRTCDLDVNAEMYILPDTSQVRVMLCFSLTLVSTTVPSSSMLGGTVGLD